ncbi:TIGR02453 family protein [Ruegeria sediminis]|uniref:TIGR02453 family protein n=1 Tax=Ruegeria sediminis TaxID=2583820 RepID=A0ABY2X2J2_9RHOB|nr:TIGR02453 family protein [Ruegeria sediminis]TMV09601.1 TIGR02453 family protein [Ruegeria sediminis]
MPDPFAQLIPEARAFLAELSANNTRDWFTAQKSRYDRELKAPATLLLDQFALQIGPGAGTKLFRPHRDVRFSKDKTPYNTHLHMLWTLPGDALQQPGFFFGISPDYVSIGGGVMGFDKEPLARWRDAVSGDFGKDMQALLAGYRDQGLRMDEPELKRVPPPFDKAHPHADLLRRKSLTVWRDLPQAAFDAPLTALQDTWQNLQPLFDRLRKVP